MSALKSVLAAGKGLWRPITFNNGGEQALFGATNIICGPKGRPFRCEVEVGDGGGDRRATEGG